MGAAVVGHDNLGSSKWSDATWTSSSACTISIAELLLQRMPSFACRISLKAGPKAAGVGVWGGPIRENIRPEKGAKLIANHGASGEA